jgi:hypothetical protein
MRPAFQVEFDEHGATYRVSRATRPVRGEGRRESEGLQKAAAEEEGRSGLLLAALRKGLPSRGRRPAAA